MFDIGWSELLIIAIVAIVVVGPKDLPRLMRKFGHYAGKLRHMANELKQQVDEAMREAELEEVRKPVESGGDLSRTFDLNPQIGGNLMLPKQDVAATSYVSSEAAVPDEQERAAPKPRRTERKAGKGSLPKNRKVAKSCGSASPVPK
jgi:sec-independent protein translocase protein TatB